jgi:hypothetical protein
MEQGEVLSGAPMSHCKLDDRGERCFADSDGASVQSGNDDQLAPQFRPS